jgi:hypothetical protein
LVSCRKWSPDLKTEKPSPVFTGQTGISTNFHGIDKYKPKLSILLAHSASLHKIAAGCKNIKKPVSLSQVWWGLHTAVPFLEYIYGRHFFV